MSPIASYLDELAALLGRRRRRRILAEVRVHLLDAAAGRAPGEGPEAAQRRAVARFGSALEVAGAFNAVRPRARALPRRVATLIMTTAATASLGTATVWALAPGASHARPAAAHVDRATHRPHVPDRHPPR